MRACGICRALLCLFAAMPRVVVWNALRDDVLRAAVRLYGRRWHLVAVAVGGGCSVRAARHRWGRISHAGAVPALCVQGWLITAWQLDVPADGRSLLLCNLPS